MALVRIGVVGPGLIWEKAHEPAINKLSDQIDIVAFSASSEASKQKVERNYPGKPFYFDYHELVQSPDVEAVLVLTPISLNAPVALAALRADKDVFLEKPMADTLEGGRELVRVAGERGKRLWILEQSAYRTAYDRVREMIEAGEIGDLVAYDQVSHSIFVPSADHVGGYAGTTWRQEADFPMGALFDGGHHPIAALSKILGAPRTVYASGVQLRPEYGETDHEMMLFDYGQGVRGFFSHSAYLSGARNHFYVRGTEGILDIARRQVTVVPNEGSPRTVDLPAENGHDQMWRAFVEAMEKGEEPYYTKESALRDLTILFSIYRSMQEGRRVEIAY